MRCRRVLAWMSLVAIAGCGRAPDAPPARERGRTVLVVSIDGLRRDYLDDREHALPHLRALASEGTVARSLVSVWPSSTYPAHTTMVTGVVPAKHGIVNNVVFDPTGANQGGWYWYARDVRVPTLWDAARDSGIDVANVTWPVTVGAPIRWNLPQYWRARTNEDDKLLAALSTPGLEDELRANGKPLPADHRSDRARADAAIALFASKRPRLAFVYLTDLDTVQHHDGPRSDEAWRTLERTDALLGEIVGAARRASDRLAVVVVSDHGFAPVTLDVKPNVALRRAGIADAYAWKSGGTAAIMGPPQAHDRVKALFVELARDPESHLGAVLEGDEVARLGGFPGALVVLQAGEGAAFSESREEPLVAPSAYRGTHGYDPRRADMAASLVLWGDGVRAHADVGDVAMIDVAPTIAALAGLRLPSADGRAIASALALDQARSNGR